VLIVVVIDGKFADSEWLLSLMGLYQTDCNKIVESKMNLDRSLQPLSREDLSRQIGSRHPSAVRSAEAAREISVAAIATGEARQESSENRESL
jgi:hypothetical protein